MPSNVNSLTVGLGWESRCDIDAGIILLNKAGLKLDALNAYSNYDEHPGIKHSGDNLTGKGKGDDETIVLDFDQIDPNVDSIWPVIVIYSEGY